MALSAAGVSFWVGITPRCIAGRKPSYLEVCVLSFIATTKILCLNMQYAASLSVRTWRGCSYCWRVFGDVLVDSRPGQFLSLITPLTLEVATRTRSIS